MSGCLSLLPWGCRSPVTHTHTSCCRYRLLLDSDLLRRRDKAVNAVVRGDMRKLTQTKDGVVTCTDEIVDLAGLSDIDPYKYIYGYVRKTLLFPPSQLPPIPSSLPSLPQLCCAFS